MTRLIAACAPLLLLSPAACSDEPAPDEAGSAAMGEVLEASISDEMIAYDRLRSQPPLAEPLPGEEGSVDAAGAGAGGASPPSADSAGEAPDDAAAAPAPRQSEQAPAGE